ncbi:MAG: sodium:proton antiporter, partial [Cyanobacteria bacterium J149]
LLARRFALNKVLDYLTAIPPDKNPDIDPEFYSYEQKLIEGQRTTIEEKIVDLQQKNPELKDISMKKLRENLLNIEADTYAELILKGELNNDLSPILQEIIAQEKSDL